MLGAIAGDVIGSRFEGRRIKTTQFSLFTKRSTFTDDTVLTIAVAYTILSEVDYVVSFKAFGRKYPYSGYGASFHDWLHSASSQPYNSWGNGSAMRVSPVGFAFNTVRDVLREARRCAEVTHNHPEGVKGAQATALAILLARKGKNKMTIKQEISQRFNYNLEQSLGEIRPGYRFDVSCQGSVPQSIIAFLESESVEDAIRKAISLGGDTDTMACIAGGIAQAYYKQIPERIIDPLKQKLPAEFWEVINKFNQKYGL